MEPLMLPVNLFSLCHRRERSSTTIKTIQSYTSHHRPEAEPPTPRSTTARLSTTPQLSSPFLSQLPLEIRLEIYEHVLALHPIQPRDLAPGLPIPIPKPLILRRTSSNTTTSDDSTRPLLSPTRPYAHIPTSLLLASRQIYHESRPLPFTHSEFPFTASPLTSPSRCGSGLAAACAFTSHLLPWQRHSLHFARLTISPSSGDLGYASFGCSPQFTSICNHWALGLRGLRLQIEGSRLDVERAGWKWVGEVRGLRALRWLEIVLVSEGRWDFEGGMSREEWVGEVERVVNAGRLRGEWVVVRCCEEVVAEAAKARPRRRVVVPGDYQVSQD